MCQQFSEDQSCLLVFVIIFDAPFEVFEQIDVGTEEIDDGSCGGGDALLEEMRCRGDTKMRSRGDTIWGMGGSGVISFESFPHFFCEPGSISILGILSKVVHTTDEISWEKEFILSKLKIKAAAFSSCRCINLPSPGAPCELIAV